MESALPGAACIAEPLLVLAALQEIQKKAKEADFELKDAVIALKTRDCRIKIKQGQDLTTGKAAGRGGVLGLVVGLVLSGPILGAPAGLGSVPS